MVTEAAGQVTNLRRNSDESLGRLACPPSVSDLGLTRGDLQQDDVIDLSHDSLHLEGPPQLIRPVIKTAQTPNIAR
jgi:hypothetical protein